MIETPKTENEGTGGPSALSAGLGTMTHFWCKVCNAIQPTFFEGAHNRDTTGTFVGGDVVCEECSFIIATAYVPNAELTGLAPEKGI